MVAVIFSVGVLSACSGSDTPMGSPQVGVLVDDLPASEPIPDVLVQLSQNSDVISAVPDVVFTQTLADSGLQVSYTHLDQLAQAPALDIEDQWIYMQSCLQLTGVAPLVLVREDEVEPFTPTDEVIRNEVFEPPDISFVPVASASTLYGTVIQVIVADFDGSLGSPSFNLRSAMGRSLWIASDLPARNYPFHCATEQP